MTGINVRLPLSRDDQDGLALNKSFEASVRQNLKNLVLTIPGERPMDSNFGVGLIEFAFDNDTPDLRAEISSKIYEQVGIYMPFVEIVNVLFVSSQEEPDTAQNFLSIFIEYNIVPLDFTDNLTLRTDGEEVVVDLVSIQKLANNDLTNTV